MPSQVGEASSFDGTRIAWQSFGEGHPVLVANGIGVSWHGMELQIASLSRHHRVITWDYRGTFGSTEVGEGGLGVRAHALDGLAALDAAGEAEASLLGWSMGAQVVFEVLREAPRRVTRVVAVGGVPWSPFRAVTTHGVHRFFQRGTQALSWAAPAASPLARKVLDSELFFDLARAIHFVGPDIDREALMAMAHDVGRHDHRTYLRTLAELGRHDARDLLPSVAVPTLFLGGANDYMIRPGTLRAAAAMVPRGVAHVVPGCSHFVMVEAADEVNALLEDFLS